MVEIAEKTEPKCEQIDCPMNKENHCIAYKDYEWATFGTKQCEEQTMMLNKLENYWR